MNRLIKRFDTDDVLMCISVGRNFRYSVDPTYKANRKGTRKPLAYQAVLERARETWPYYEHDGIEADDVMGIFGSRLANSVICSMDKDMQTIPCTLWDGKKVRKITREEADRWFFYQVLIGDTADGYPGCPGVGPKKAKVILKKPKLLYGELLLKEWWKRIVEAFVQRGMTEADAIKQARLARILRTEDWDAKKKEPILWTPPT